MRRIRVLIVDDAVVARKMVGEALADDPEIEVVGTAANGRLALQKLTQVNPDLVTLDVEMPEMDGLATLKALRVTHPRLPVIMFSSLTGPGAATTVEALALGASDYASKPAGGGAGAVLQCIRQELVPKIKALCWTRTAAGDAPRAPTPAPDTPCRPEIVAVGVSTGGPNALAEIVRQLPGDFPLPIVIVQHMPAVFTRYLAERLAARSRITVREAAGGEVLEPASVLIAPGEHHLVLCRKGPTVVTTLTQEPPENSCRPSVDVLFRSVHEVYGGRALAVVLTGMGRDGFRGCELIKHSGGSVVVQDEETSVVWGMPGFVARAGLADRILPLNRIAQELVARAGGLQPSHAENVPAS